MQGHTKTTSSIHARAVGPPQQAAIHTQGFVNLIVVFGLDG